MAGSYNHVEYLKQENYLLRRTELHEDTLSDNCLAIEKTSVAGKNDKGSEILSDIIITIGFEKQELHIKLHKNYGIAESINQKLIREF